MATPSNEPAPPLSSPPGVSASDDPARWFAHEVHAHDGQLKSYLRDTFPRVRDVEDVVQESYLRIWKVQSQQPIRSAKSFLFTVARHLALNLLRRERISPVISEGDLSALSVMEDRPSVVELLTEQEKVDLLGDALVALPARTREIIILHKFKGLSQSEVAERLGLTAKAVERQIARGVERCVQFIQSRGL